MAGHKSSAVDKQAVVAKLMKRWKKEFGGLPKREPMPVLETLIYALLLEDSPFEAGQEAYDKLKASFYDWNEVRVTTITELEPIFACVEQGEWRAMRIRYLLHYVFDHQYSYDFDALKKKTQELVHKQLAKIKHLTPFSRNYLLQTSLGNHIIPLDSKMCQLAVWLGMLPNGTGPEEGAELLKSTVRKADGAEFFFLLKSCSVHSKAAFLKEINFAEADPSEFDLASAEERLEDLFNGKAGRRIDSQPRERLAGRHGSAQAEHRHRAGQFVGLLLQALRRCGRFLDQRCVLLGHLVEVGDRLADLVEAGEIRSTLTQTLSPISAATLEQAHQQLRSGRTVGKIALQGWG